MLHLLEVTGALSVTAVCFRVQMGEVQYEERVYPAGYWACVTREEALYEQSISMGFMKLMRFICKENSAGQTPTTQRAHTHTPVLPPTILVFPYVDSTHTTHPAFLFSCVQYMIRLNQH